MNLPDFLRSTICSQFCMDLHWTGCLNMDPVMLGTTLALMFIMLPPLSRMLIVVSAVFCVWGFSDPKVTQFISDSSPLLRFNLFANDSVMYVL